MPGSTSSEDRELPLTEHLRELRSRILVSLASVVAGAVLTYAVSERLFRLLSGPLLQVLPPGRTLIFTSYTEAFFTYIKLAVAGGIFLALPVILYEAWAFVSPGLYPHERRLVLPFIVGGSLLFLLGAAFGYFLAFPPAFRFLAGYSKGVLRLYPSMGEYLGLAIRLLIGFGLAFEVPLLVVLLGLAGLVDSKRLRKARPYALLGAFVVAAVATPTPDVVNQCLLALPVIALYELGIWLLVLLRR